MNPFRPWDTPESARPAAAPSIGGFIEFTWCDHTVLICDRHESAAIVAAELAQDVSHVALSRHRADHKPLGVSVVAESARHEQEDVALAVGQFGKRRRRRPGVSRQAANSAIS